jgi:hypothetical protein
LKVEFNFNVLFFLFSKSSISLLIQIGQISIVNTGSYYLVDSGYPLGGCFMPPHKSIRYHAQEYTGRHRRPKSVVELFNYWHSSLRMVVERTFKVLKARFPIFYHMPNYFVVRQRMIVTTCCIIHNFIRLHQRNDQLFLEWQNKDLATNDDGGIHGLQDMNDWRLRQVEVVSKTTQGKMRNLQDAITTTMWAGH